MAKKLRDEELRFTVIVNGKEGQKAINDLQKANRKLAAENDTLLSKQKKLEQQGKKNSAEWQQLEKRIKENSSAMEKNSKRIKDHYKELGVSQLTMRQLRAEAKRLRQELSDLNPDSEEFDKLTKQLKAVNERMFELRNQTKATGGAIEELEEHSGALADLWTGLSTGHIPTLQRGLQGVAGNIKGITKAALTFIATPIGAVIATLATVGIGLKKWIDFNLEVEKTNQLVRDLTQESGTAVDAIRVRAEVLQQTFGTEMQESINTAKSLVKSLGISYDEAFDIIEQGGIRGKLRNDEFLDSLREYPIQFKNAGFTAQEFASIVNAGIDLSIYSDKLPDAVKEFVLSVTEQTPAAREALENAFGSEFTDKLFKDLKSGAIEPKEALAAIAAEADRIGLNSQQAQLLTADLFKGAGEDAGGALKIFEAINIALNDQKKPLTEIQLLQQEQIKKQTRLKEITTGLFATSDSGFGKMIQQAKIFVTDGLIKIITAGVDLVNWFVELNNKSGAFSVILISMKVSATSTFKLIGELINGAAKGFKGLLDVVEGVFTGNSDKIKDGITKSLQAIPHTTNAIKEQAKKDAQEIFDAFSGKNKLKKISLDDLVAGGGSDSKDKDVVTNTNSTEGNNAATAKADLFKKGEEELTKIILAEREKRRINALQGFKKEEAEITARFKKIIDQHQGHSEKIKELEQLRDDEIAERKLAHEAETAQRIRDLEEQNRIEEEALRLEREAMAAATDEEKALILLQRTQFIASEQLRIEEEKELARIRLAGATEAEIAAIKKKFALKNQQVELAFDKGKKALKKDEVKWEKLTQDQKFNLVRSGLSQAAEAFNKQTAAYKAIKISETLITTYQSAVNSYNSLSGIPIVGPVLGAAAAAAAVVSGIAQVRKIASTKEEKMPGFERGFYPKRNITRTDGKTFNSAVKPKAFTQTVTQPTYFQDANILTGEGGPELIVDAPTFRSLRPEVIDEVYATRNRVHGFQDGFFPQRNQSSSTAVDQNNEQLMQMMEMMISTQERLNERLNEPLDAVAYYDDEQTQIIKEKQREQEQAREGAIVR